MKRMPQCVMVLTMMVMVISYVHADFHREEKPGYFDSISTWFREHLPWGSRLGHDWSDTQDKVENIYRDTHATAQQRVDDLKEDALKGVDVREKIADIYSEAAADAERRIERLQHGLFHRLFHGSEDEHEGGSGFGDKLSDKWDTVKAAAGKFGDKAGDTASKLGDKASDKFDSAKSAAGKLGDKASDKLDNLKDKASDAASKLGDKASDAWDSAKDAAGKFGDKASDKWDSAKSAAGHAYDKVKDKFAPQKKHHSLFKDTTKKIGDSYRSALDKAKSAMGSLKQSSDDTLASTKSKAKKLYDEAFHRSHGDARSIFGKFRDMIGSGFHRATHHQTAACKTWGMVKHIGLGVFWCCMGALAYSVAMFFYNQAQFKRQLNSQIPGQIVHVQEYMLLGGENLQRKWLDYWTTTGAAFFNKQGGLRKFGLHRGVDPLTKKWICMGEWNSVDDLRRALLSPEFADLKRRAPATVLAKESIVTAVGVGGKEEVVSASVPGQLRQRTTTPQQTQTVS